ncbi:hypothetical protein QOT17_010882 [Balamuthia mandrillaris]
MVVKEAKEFELYDLIKDASPLHPVLVYFYEDGAPLHFSLAPVFEQIAREAPLAVCVRVSDAECDEQATEKYGISCFPCFLICKGPSKEKWHTFPITTGQGLIKTMEQQSIIKEGAVQSH